MPMQRSVGSQEHSRLYTLSPALSYDFTQGSTLRQKRSALPLDRSTNAHCAHHKAEPRRRAVGATKGPLASTTKLCGARPHL
jgi:hypothetical protein